jgi:predicted RNA-binding Zn-ribbon protein involved in translation (DUF1610 family)
MQNEAKAEKLICSSCGSTDVSFNVETGKFRCDFCRTEVIPASDNLDEGLTGDLSDVEHLHGIHKSTGMSELIQSEEDVISFKCPSCGAEMSTCRDSDNVSLTCHWCRHHISAANKILNGAIPDGVLPFSVTKEQAKQNIGKYLKKKRFFACPKFIKTFSADQIRPVYLPYIVVDANVTCDFVGQGAIRTKTRQGDKNSSTTYDYDLYDVERSFDMSVNDLLIEANTNYIIKPGEKPKDHSKNIINYIQPFGLKHIASYNTRFLNGEYRAEFRNVSLDDIKEKITSRVRDIALFRTSETLSQYTHGVRIGSKSSEKIGERYSSILCPVWLYSYQDQNGKLHYACVNGQTGKTAGSVPIWKAKLFAVSAIIQLIGMTLGVLFWWAWI